MKTAIKTFEQFSEAVQALAGDKYFAVKMEKTVYTKHEDRKRDSDYHYQCYVDGQNWYSGRTPELAIENLKNGMGINTSKPIEAEIK